MARFKIERDHMTITGVYAPEEGKNEETTQFYKRLQREIDIVCGDLNARVGNNVIPQIMGPHEERHLNNNGEPLLHFAAHNSLRTSNTFFRKKTYINLRGQPEV